MSDPMPSMTADAPRVDESLITYTHVIYALHALAVLIGITTVHTIVCSFMGGLPSIIAVIMNYARRSATVGTFLESHFRWQIRTFWFALLWALVAVGPVHDDRSASRSPSSGSLRSASGSSIAWCAAGSRCGTGDRCTCERRDAHPRRLRCCCSRPAGRRVRCICRTSRRPW